MLKKKSLCGFCVRDGEGKAEKQDFRARKAGVCVCVSVCVCLSVCLLWPSHLNPEKAGVCVCVCVCVLWSQLDLCSVRAGGPTAPLQLPDLSPRWSYGPGLGQCRRMFPCQHPTMVRSTEASTPLSLLALLNWTKCPKGSLPEEEGNKIQMK